MRRKYDILWKGILEEVFDDMLRFIFPEIDKELDMQRGFEFLDKELSEMYPEPEKVSHTRVVDKIEAIMTFLNNYVLFKNPQINRTLCNKLIR